VKHTRKEFNWSESKGAANEAPTCSVPVHASIEHSLTFFLSSLQCSYRTCRMRVPGLPQITCRMVLTKMRGHSGEKSERKDKEIEKLSLDERWGCERIGHVDQKSKSGRS